MALNFMVIIFGAVNNNYVYFVKYFNAVSVVTYHPQDKLCFCF